MKLPALFVGHGSPMIALEDSQVTRNFLNLGKEIIKTYGKPKGILAISAHWFTRGNFTQKDENPKQIYDMYGFPDALYQVKYPVKGATDLGQEVLDLLGEDVALNHDWGIDHGTWTVLVHMFPLGDIPVTQLSVNGLASPEEVYALGKRLAPLRDQGYLILGSGNIVHNLRETNWEEGGASQENKAFDKFIVDSLKEGQVDKVLNYKDHPQALYAVPTLDHFYPLLYVLGASQKDQVQVFNQVGTLGSISMSSFIFG